jgi:hypothetical protein
VLCNALTISLEGVLGEKVEDFDLQILAPTKLKELMIMDKKVHN